MGMYDDIVEMVSGHLRFEGFPDHLTIARRIVSEDECREAQEELKRREQDGPLCKKQPEQCSEPESPEKLRPQETQQ
jgi:hypothetical protein